MPSNRPDRPLTQDEIDEYHRNGVVKLDNVIPLAWIEYLKPAVEEAMANPGPLAEEYGKGSGRFFGEIDVSRRIDRFSQFVNESPAAEIMATVMGSSRINFFYDQLLVKEPGTAEHTPWHQDQPYWAVSGRQVASIWMPLDSVAKESSLSYVKGSHRWDAHSPYHFADGTPYEGRELPALPDIDAHPDQYEVVAWDMNPGDCLVFQAMIVHGSAGNLSSSIRRRAWATRWTGDDARYRVYGGEAGYPVDDPGLQHGDRMDCDMFPLILSSFTVRSARGGASESDRAK